MTAKAKKKIEGETVGLLASDGKSRRTIRLSFLQKRILEERAMTWDEAQTALGLLSPNDRTAAVLKGLVTQGLLQWTKKGVRRTALGTEANRRLKEKQSTNKTKKK